MASSIAWIDTSPDEQRRIRELIKLFAQPESRDELGMGQVRDSLSDLLFPGTSTLHTRARYFVLIPWCFQHVTARRRGRDVAAHVKRAERELVESLRRDGASGIIGARVGAQVKNLPSTLYWSALVSYGILTRDLNPDQLTGSISGLDPDADEAAARPRHEWHPRVPKAPSGFPRSLDDGIALGGLELRPAEASWLRERMVENARDSLLEHLLLADEPPGAISRAPWEDPLCVAVEGGPRHVMEHARALSLLVQGAALVYNVLIAEAYEAAGFDRVREPVAKHSAAFEEWLDRADELGNLRAWDSEEFWSLVDNPRISVVTRRFVDTVAVFVRDGTARTVVDDPGSPLRALVADRERFIKGGQSRLGVNRKLLGAWGGSSGADEIVFRWGQVRRIVTDVHEGLARA
jgi:hypothetical protein